MKGNNRGQGRGRRKRKLSLLQMFLLDFVLVGVGLLVFALFHHVIPRPVDMSNAIVVDRYAHQPSAAQAPAATAAAMDASADDAQTIAASMDAALATQAPVEPTAAPAPVGYFGDKFADKFTNGEIFNDGQVFRNQNVNVTMRTGEFDGATYYLADIYIRDISNLVAGLAHDSFGKNTSERPASIAERLGSVVAINGDYYSVHDSGVVIRNGTVFRTEVDTSMDICVLYYDGTMETISPSHFDADAAIEKGAYQAWSFGPRLLVDGVAQEFFNTTVSPANPRAVIGYYEPGHYCFVVVDGRNAKTQGLTMRQTSLLMESLGCNVAFNLDGGNTAQMICGSTVVNNPSGDRNCSDIVAIVG